MSIENLTLLLRQFAKDRDWDQYHSPKNLAMALSVEASELLEHFQWLTEKQSAELEGKKRDEVAEEMADVFLYLLRMADKLDIDLLEEANKKIVKNAEKYPAHKVKGSSKKYTEYSQDDESNS
jgi:NTP pyrophosphatase (non-canonical NTP hydrolase)